MLNSLNSCLKEKWLELRPMTEVVRVKADDKEVRVKADDS